MTSSTTTLDIDQTTPLSDTARELALLSYEQDCMSLVIDHHAANLAASTTEADELLRVAAVIAQREFWSAAWGAMTETEAEEYERLATQLEDYVPDVGAVMPDMVQWRAAATDVQLMTAAYLVCLSRTDMTVPVSDDAGDTAGVLAEWVFHQQRAAGVEAPDIDALVDQLRAS